MWALEHPSATRTAGLFADTPVTLLAALASAAVPVAGLTAGHGALLATALAWARRPPATVALAVGLIAVAAAASGLGAFGPLAYLALPIWLFVLARGGRLAALGL